MMPLRVMVIADDLLVRNGLAALLSDGSDCLVVGQIASDVDVVAEAALYRPDIVLWDMGWEPVDISRLEYLGELRDHGINSIVLLQDARSGVDAWRLGARGLLMRQVEAERLIAALRAVEQGLVVWDETVAIPMVTAATDALSGIDVLTPREHEVLALLAEGLPNKIVANRLQISEHTVKFHVNAIMGKLGAQSRTEAVVLATRRGLILL
jgi:two-component system, NarL family, nitrate/nitrite response regulator NarL